MRHFLGRGGGGDKRGETGLRHQGDGGDKSVVCMFVLVSSAHVSVLVLLIIIFKPTLNLYTLLGGVLYEPHATTPSITM